MGQTKLPFEYTVCIDDLIGPKFKAEGIKCPCPKCSPEGIDVGPNSVRPADLPEEDKLLDRQPRRIPADAIRDGTEKEED